MYFIRVLFQNEPRSRRLQHALLHSCMQLRQRHPATSPRGVRGLSVAWCGPEGPPHRALAPSLAAAESGRGNAWKEEAVGASPGWSAQAVGVGAALAASRKAHMGIMQPCTFNPQNPGCQAGYIWVHTC
jgi:hypothetical protein